MGGCRWPGLPKQCLLGGGSQASPEMPVQFVVQLWLTYILVENTVKNVDIKGTKKTDTG